MNNIISAVNELHGQGLSYAQIANELGISKSKAYRIINDGTDVPENETDSETKLPETFRNEGNKPKIIAEIPEKESDNLKLKVKLKKMELKHEEKMKLLEMQELEKRREFETEQNEIINENIRLKSELEKIQKESEEEDTDEVIPEYDDDDERIDEFDETVRELDPELKHEVKTILTDLMEQEKFSLEDLEDYKSSVNDLKNEISEYSETENLDENNLFEFGLLKKIEDVLEYYIDHFDDHRAFFRSKINLELKSGLYKKIVRYINTDSD